MNQNRKHAPVSWKRGLVSLLVAMLVLNLCMPGIVTRAEELPAQEATAQVPEEGTVLLEGGAAEENLQPLTEEDSQEEITKEDTKEDTTEEEASEDATKEDTTTEEESSEDITKEDTTTEDGTSEDTTKEDTTTENGASEDTTKEDTTTGEGTTEEIPSEDTAVGEVASNEIQVGTNDVANGQVAEEATAAEGTQELLDYLLSARTYEELDDMMENMTEDEYVILKQFNDEQNAALTAHVEKLSNYEAIQLDAVTLKQGDTATYTQSVYRNNYDFQIVKDGSVVSSSASGITVTNEGDYTIKVTTSESTPVGEYTIRFGYQGIYRFYEDGNISLTVTEMVDADTPVENSKKMTFDKTVIANANGNYDLKLTLSGAVGSKTDPAKVDVVLVIDKSGSMEGNRLKNAKSAANTLINALNTNENIDARYNIVTFSGSSSEEDRFGNYIGHTVDYGTDTSGWTNSAGTATSYVSNISAKGATNYEAGLLQAQTQLQSARSGATTIVVFLTDGLPTLRVSTYYNNDKNGYGYGAEGYPASEERCLQDAINAVAKIAMSRFYVIGTGTANESNLTRLANGAALANYKTVKYTSDSNLNQTFSDIASDISVFLCENVTITDTLHHVGGKTALDRMVEVTNVDTVKVTVYKDDEILAGPAKEVSLAATDTNVASKLTASYDQTTGVLKLDFPDKYQLEPDYTYVLSAEIAPTEKAYEEYRKTGYTESGESNTGTHSGDFGFYSNDSAMVTYTYQDEESYEVYAHPVVKLKPGTLVINKTIVGMNPEQLSELEFNVTIQYPGKEETTQTIPFADFKPTENEGTYTYPMTGLSPNTIYSVQESGLDVEGYQVAVVAEGGDEVENYVVSGTVEKGATDTVEFTNTYSLANTTITLDKNVAGNMGSYNDEFTFNVTIDGEDYSGNPIKLTHLSDPVEITVPIGARVVITEVASGNYVASATVDGEKVNLNGETDKTLTIEAVDAAGHVVVFTNTNEAVIETGLRVDSFPMYLLMSTMIVFGGLLLIRKRRCGDWM